MTSSNIATLHKVQADWLRVQGEVAYVRMLFAATKYRDAIAREQRFNPYHDDAGRFTTADGAGGSGAGGEPRRDRSDGVRIALADPRITAALSLFTFLSGQKPADETPFVQFNARSFVPGAGRDATAVRVGSLSRDEVDSNCPRHVEVQKLTDHAVTRVEEEGNYWGATAKGSRIHSALKESIDGLNDGNFRAEVSAIKSKEEAYGARNSIRVDVLENVGNGTVCVYDIKTGKIGLSIGRMQEIANNVHSLYPGTQKVVLIETRPK